MLIMECFIKSCRKKLFYLFCLHGSIWFKIWEDGEVKDVVFPEKLSKKVVLHFFSKKYVMIYVYVDSSWTNSSQSLKETIVSFMKLEVENEFVKLEMEKLLEIFQL
jgi:hypothetical protein